MLDQIEDKLELSFRELGRQNLKKSPSRSRFMPLTSMVAADLHHLSLRAPTPRARDKVLPDIYGVRLAYAKVGTGPPLVRPAHWLGHLEYDFEPPISRHLLVGLARDFTLTRYDARGNGLSDWDVGELSLDAWVSDLETVVDAAGLERFLLLGMSQGCAVAIAFAVRHPQRVSHLVLYGGFAVGRRKRPNATDADRERFAAMVTLMKLGWGADNPTFRQMFTLLLLPTATREHADAFNELQRKSASPECAVRYYETVNNFDVRPLLPQVATPTLVMHVRDDAMVPARYCGCNGPANVTFVLALLHNYSMTIAADLADEY